nr:MAG TPA: Dna polymerase B [Caudoviricetes sp.]
MMAIVRTKREHNYTIVSNKVYDKNQLSWQAMGLLGYLLTKPDNWQVVVSELVNATKNTKKPTGREGVYNIINELKEKGFISVVKNSDGSTDYTVYDEPVQQLNHENPNQAEPNQGKPNQAEPTLINTDIQQVLNNTNTPLPPNAENGKDGLNADAFVSADAETCERGSDEPTSLETKNDSNGNGSLSGKPKNANVPRRRKSDGVPLQEIADLYNEVLGGRLPSVQVLNDTRKRAIVNRWCEMLGTAAPNGKVRFGDKETGLAWFAGFFRKVAMNPFWMGENQTGFAVNFDWIFKAGNFVKILEWHPPKTN